MRKVNKRQNIVIIGISGEDVLGDSLIEDTPCFAHEIKVHFSSCLFW